MMIFNFLDGYGWSAFLFSGFAALVGFLPDRPGFCPAHEQKPVSCLYLKRLTGFYFGILLRPVELYFTQNKHF